MWEFYTVELNVNSSSTYLHIYGGAWIITDLLIYEIKGIPEEKTGKYIPIELLNLDDNIAEPGKEGLSNGRFWKLPAVKGSSMKPNKLIVIGVIRQEFFRNTQKGSISVV